MADMLHSWKIYNYLDPPVGVSNGLPHTTYRLPDRAPLGGSW